MCGICGIVSSEPHAEISESILLSMRDSLLHRGPDDGGHYVAPGVGLGSRRLAILDLSSRGHMPMVAGGGRYRIVYNGEVYNFRELRKTLEARGCAFQSDTDTEVVLNLYMMDGPAMLDRLNGMFAIAIWDSQERALFIGRDRLGIKPLYYAIHNNRFYFASEEKALFLAGVPAAFNHETWGELLCFRYTAGERTPFAGIRRLLPGHYLIWKDGRVDIRRWWNLSLKVLERRDSPSVDAEAAYRELFDDAVRLRRISDVPIGVLLSGGLDSGTVAATLAGQAGAGVASFTVRFEEEGYDEGPLARKVVGKWGLQGHELMLSGNDIPAKLRVAAALNDGPLAHGNDVHLLTISQYAKPRVTVLLSGEGADETLGGYVRYQPLRFPFLLQLLRAAAPARGFFTGARWKKLFKMTDLGPLDRFVIFNACDVFPADIERLGLSVKGQLGYREQVLREAGSLYRGELMRQAMYVDQHTFLCSVLDRNDRMTMGASIECRVPFLDYRIIESLASLPSSQLIAGRKTKPLLRSALGSRLPQEVLQGRKWGFGVPWRRYFRQNEELRTMLVEMPRSSLLADSPLRSSVVESEVKAFLQGNDEPFPRLLQIMMVLLSWQAVGQLKPGFRVPSRAN